MRKISKQNIFLISLAIGMVAIVIIISTLSLTKRPQDNTTLPLPTSSLFPSSSPSLPKYAPNSAQKLIDKLVTRTPVSDTDMLAKEKILAQIPNAQISGIVYSSANVSIDYTHAADEIQVEILTTDIARAKTEAEKWLKSQGLSQDGICNLPISFYLRRDVLEQLRGKNVTFSPLADGC